MKKIILALVLVFSSLAAKANNSYCNFALTGSSAMTPTELFTSYLSKLIEDQILSIDYLYSIEKEGLALPLKKFYKQQSFQDLHEPLIKEYIVSKEVDLKAFSQWVSIYLTKHKEIEGSKGHSRQVNKKAVIKMKFNRVKAGPFPKLIAKLELSGNEHFDKKFKLPTVVDYDFEMMETKVTQRMWLDTMGTLPVSGTRLPIHDDMAIAYINWWEAVVFANKVSKIHGYPEVYDLSGIEFKNTSGALEPVDASKAQLIMSERLLKINVKEVYGYRLPNIIEQIFVNTKLSDKDLHNGFTEQNIDSVARYEKNSNGEMHPLATLAAIKIDGQNFYDLTGNAAEFTHDWASYSDERLASTNKMLAKINRDSKLDPFLAIYHGTHAFGQFVDLAANNFHTTPLEANGFIVGLRLVRTLQ